MKILAGNWKLYKNRKELFEFHNELPVALLQKEEGLRKIICVSPPLLESAAKIFQGSSVEIFSQNVAWAKEGAWTGEISPLQLKDLNIKGTLVGHSERRQHFGDTIESCLKRAQCALECGLDVIFCVGENLDERKANQTNAVLEAQLKDFIALLGPQFASKLIIAYEPVWAIGTGLTATTKEIEEAHRFISDLCEKNGLKCPILYGGSVKPDNFASILSTPAVAGGLVGGASLQSASFVALHKSLKECK